MAVIDAMELKISRLPKWVQEHIQDLNRQIRDANRIISEYEESREKTRISFTDFSRSKTIYLSENSNFNIDVATDPNDNKAMLNVSLERRAVQRGEKYIPLIIRDISSARVDLCVRPLASNSVEIILKEY